MGRNESVSLQHLPSRDRIPGASANSSGCHLLLGEKGCEPNWPSLKASRGGLHSSVRAVQKQCLEVPAATKKDFADYHGVPSVPEAVHPHFKPGDRDGSFITKIIGLSSGRGQIWSPILLFFTRIKFQMKTTEIEESSGDYIRVVKALPNITSNP